ncbi:hypothetical protein HII13_001522 [Brettanomyces bruxellensis]|nr:hypothetical protein HII13_001522 [Brettanomyces bruxellensis]
MHIVKFPCLAHRESNHSYEVYCITVSADGKRLASGGLDGKIRIWSIDTLRKYEHSILEANSSAKHDKSGKIRPKITSDSDENGSDKSSEKTITQDPSECRDLCSMSRHTGAVTCLKFSPNGRFLALALEARKSLKNGISGSSSAFGLDSGGNGGEMEHWTVRKRLVAHDNDIQDMAWAPDSSILVTVGLDRSIIRFDIHESHVKGVTFDPANKYFATCSDDRTMRIFRYRRSSPTEISFSVESVVREPFQNTPLTTYYRRCTWSPDGQYIAAPNAVNGGMCSVAIVKRGSWLSDISLLGHELPCEVCSFSPRLYRLPEENRGRSNKRHHGKSGARMSEERNHASSANSVNSTREGGSKVNEDGKREDGKNEGGRNEDGKNENRKNAGRKNEGKNNEDEVNRSRENSKSKAMSGTHSSLSPKPASNSPPSSFSTILATGGQDRSLVIWSTASARPLVVARDLTSKTITDICWDPSGRIIFLSSLDGSITTAFFGRDELGTPIPLNQNSAQLHRYGADRESAYFPESVDQLLLEDSQRKLAGKTPVNSRMEKLMTARGFGIGKNGQSGFALPSSTSQPQKRSILMSKKPTINVLVPRSKKHPNRKINVLTLSSQKMSVTKSGKKRVTPTLISSSSGISGFTNSFASRSGLSKSTDSIKLAQKLFAKPFVRLPKAGLQTLVSGVRDNLIQLPPSNSSSLSTSNFSNSSLLSSSSSGNQLSLAGKVRGGASGGFPPLLLLNSPRKHKTPSRSSLASRRLKHFGRYPAFWADSALESSANIEKLPNTIVAQKKSNLNGTPFGYVLEVRNQKDSVPRKEVGQPVVSTAFCVGASKKTMEYFVNGKVKQVAESQFEARSSHNMVEYWAIATQTGCISILTKTGRQFMPPIQLGSELSHLLAAGKFLLAITFDGLVYTWNLQAGLAIVDGISLSPLISPLAQYDSHRRKFQNKVKFASVSLLPSNGIPLIGLTNGDLYTFDVGLGVWVNIIDSRYTEQLDLADLKKCLSFDQISLQRLAFRVIKAKSKQSHHSQQKIADSNVLKSPWTKQFCESFEQNVVNIKRRIKKSIDDA